MRNFHFLKLSVFAFVSVLFFSSPQVFCESYKNRLQLKIELLPEAEKKSISEMNKLRRQIIAKLQKANIKYSSSTLNKLVKEEYLSILTFEDFMEMLTPKSRKWFVEFFDNYKPKYLPDFDKFYQLNKSKTIKQIRDHNLSIHKSRTQSRRATTHELPLWQVSSTATEPHISDISGSRMIRKDNYANQLRYLISNPNQSLFLRGRYDNSQTPYFPDYDNVYCDACCGPAAGQSILEWFNVPVKKPNGTILTSSYDIQKRLANLMDTTDGIDYTHPDDLADALKRNEFVGNKGYCYSPGGGSIKKLRYMLASGTPVILLIAKDDWAHYITAYGYNVDNDKYLLANTTDRSQSALIDLWSFANTAWYADAVYYASGTHPRTLFSYCSDGCDLYWNYTLRHEDLLADHELSPSDRDELYYEKFIRDYVIGHDEDGLLLNFFAYYSYDWADWTEQLANLEPTLPVTEVSSGFQSINLHDVNLHIINYRSPSDHFIGNNSLNEQIQIEVWVDKQFLDEYEDLYCGFIVKDENRQEVLTHYGQFMNYVDTIASNSNASNYVFKYGERYQPNQKTIDFIIHGGFRRISWELGGCSLDNDNDLVCDQIDTDDDNDGILDTNDNCPTVANPSQEDNDNNGYGLACDDFEQCLLACDPNYFDNQSSQWCYIQCSGLVIPVVELDQSWMKLLESKWWDLFPKDIDINDPKIMTTVAFEGLYQDYYKELLQVQRVEIDDEKGKEIFWNLLRRSQRR